MQRFAEDTPVDYCIVGVGSAGGVLLQRLARAGFRVVGLEAGPFWDTERDWVSDEAGSQQLYWDDLRITGGKNPLALGANNSGKGVGGGSVHWAAFTPRLHPSDFRVHSEDGVASTGRFLRGTQALLRVARARDPGLRAGLFPVGRSARLRLRAASDGRGRRRARSADVRRLASGSASAAPSPSSPDRTATGRTASTGDSASRAARWAPSEHAHQPRAGRHRAWGGDPRPTAWSRASTWQRRAGDRRHLLRSRRAAAFSESARRSSSAGYAIETPRLLLNSACAGFENGLANASGTRGTLSDGPGRQRGARPLRRAGPDVQGAARPRA